MSEPPTANGPTQPAREESSFLLTLEQIILAFILAFAFRAFVVEAFVIPSGSMAPTLRGEHHNLTCSGCGWKFALGATSYTRQVACPMCNLPIAVQKEEVRAGDRILVLKYLYAFREPRRWEVVVFKNPNDPPVNYIKRLVGLPNEALWIVDGNIFTRPLRQQGQGWAPDETVPWRIQRKGPDVQRAVWQPVHRGDYRPILNSADPDSEPWSSPWQPMEESEEFLGPDGRTGGWNYAGGLTPAVLSFGFTERNQYDNYTYNGSAGYGGRGGNLISELRLACSVRPLKAKEVGTRLWLECSNLDLQLRCLIEPDGTVLLQSRPRSSDKDPATVEWATRSRGRISPLAPDRTTHVELWHVDQALGLWVDGQRVALWEYDLADVGQSVEELARPRRYQLKPEASIGLQGAPAILRGLDLDRDLYYTRGGGNNFGSAQPAVIGPDRFYVLGDNSPSSQDSRAWTDVHSTVTDYTMDKYRQANGNPGLDKGLVPRQLMLGKAFFVYYPAPHRFGDGSSGLVPDFGRMRMIR